jgi:hypothetical protein
VGMIRFILGQVFVLYVATNMALCSVVFIAWALPRETISGLLGRWETMESGWKYRFALVGSWIVDRIYFWEPDHCVAVYVDEEKARAVLYPKKDPKA